MADSQYEKIAAEVLKFRDERDWTQFHTIQGLITSVNLEASELMELTQWKTTDQIEQKIQDPEFCQAIKEESADVLLYLTLLAEKMGFSLLDAAQEKLTKNAEKYPVDKARGNAKKYSSL